MKAIYCRICHSLVQMEERLKSCYCGNVCAKALDGHRIGVHAIFSDWAIPLSISNAFLDDDNMKAREAVGLKSDWDIVKYDLGSKHAESCGIFEIIKDCKKGIEIRTKKLKIVLIAELVKEGMRVDVNNKKEPSAVKFEKDLSEFKKKDLSHLFNTFVKARQKYYKDFISDYDPND